MESLSEVSDVLIARCSGVGSTVVYERVTMMMMKMTEWRMMRLMLLLLWLLGLDR